MFNYVKFLEGLRMIGPFHPWKKDDGDVYKALLVPVENAQLECTGWSNQEMTRSEFLSYLKLQDVLVFGNVEDFVKWRKGEKKPSGKKFKRVISEERRIQLRNHAKSMREKIKASTSENA